MGNIMDFETKVKQLFLKLNQSKVCYVVLRNWEDFYSDLLIDGHNDIDILCKTERDKKTFVRLFDAKHIGDPYFGKYSFFINNNKFYIDFRVVGDGYYCRKWEQQMLKTRILDEKGFYKLDNEEYYFSLLYHAIIHKNQISENYNKILSNLFSNIKLKDYESILTSFMSEKKYYYSVSYDRFVGQNFKGNKIKIKKELSTKCIYLKIRMKKRL